MDQSLLNDDVQASGTKSGKQQIEGAPEGITSDKETINAIIRYGHTSNRKS